jgi:hypothetical protein
MSKSIIIIKHLPQPKQLSKSLSVSSLSSTKHVGVSADIVLIGSISKNFNTTSGPKISLVPKAKDNKRAGQSFTSRKEDREKKELKIFWHEPIRRVWQQ